MRRVLIIGMFILLSMTLISAERPSIIINKYSTSQLNNNANFINLTQNSNETQIILNNNASWLSTYNSTYAIWSYNQTYSGSTYNLTYAIWAYNQTQSIYYYNQTNTHFFYNMTNTHFFYNMTDTRFYYNQTLLGDNLYISMNSTSYFINENKLNLTIARYTSNLTTPLNNTIYNFTYHSFAYNQSLSNTITIWLYNQTLLGDNLYINLNASSYFIVESQLNKTIALYTSNLTASLNNTIYNFTYHSFAYNQTIASGWNLSETNLFTGRTNYNVGIGTSSPSSLLHINGTGNLFKITNITNILLFVNETSTIINNSLDAQTMYKVSSQNLILALNFNNDSITNINSLVYALDSSGTNSHGFLGINATYNDSDGFNGGGGISMYAEAQRYINGTITAFHNVSVTMWAKIDPNSAGAGNYRRFFYLDTSGTDFAVYLHNTANDINVVGSVTCDTNYVPSTGVWHFYSFIHNGGNIKTYMDGELINSCSNNINGNLGGTYWIGSTVSGTAQYWNGSIDEVKIYSRPLSQNEIRRLYYQRSEGLPSFVSQKYINMDRLGRIMNDIVLFGDGGVATRTLNISVSGSVGASVLMLNTPEVSWTIANTLADQFIIGKSGLISPSFLIDDATNYVGIGESTPLQKLDIAGNIKTNLTGTGNDYVCVNSDGVLFRNDVACT